MRQFFKNVFSSFVGTFIALSFMGFIATVAFIGLAAGLGKVFDKGLDGSGSIEGYNFLKLHITGNIVDYAEPNPFSKVKGIKEFFPTETGVYQITEAISTATLDNAIEGIYLRVDQFSGGFAQAESIRNALLQFKSSGKKIIAYTQNVDEKGYHILQVADQLAINPLGILEFNGLNVEILFLTGLFEKIGVEMQIFKAGKFKSAVEPYFRKSMSDANREQVSSFTNDINNHLLKSAANSRELSFEEVKSISNEMLIRNAKDALLRQFVDTVAYEKDFLVAQKELLGIKDLVFADYMTYNTSSHELGGNSGEKVVILSTEGQIIDGVSQTNSQIGDRTVVEQLEKLAKDSSVKAVVLQINSPGGSATASDRIWQAIQNVKMFKPVIASMSTYAASGGYYMAMGCDQIVAQPNTITGSIGVFGVFPNFESLYEDKLGITSDGVKTGEYSDLFSVAKQMSPGKKAIIQGHIEEFYRVFLNKVSSGRGLAFDVVAGLAEGRVWTGQQALKNGLVDRLGGLEVAIEQANPNNDFQIIPYKKYAEQDLDEYIEGFSPDKLSIESKLLHNEQLRLFKELQVVKNSSGIQARAPYILDIK